MPVARRFGLTVPLAGQPLSAHPEIYRVAADAGYTDLWSSESNATDAFTPLAHAATLAPDLHVGTAIVPAFTRAPGVIAMQAASLAQISRQPVNLGIGSSSAPIVQSWNGVPFRKPFTRVADLVEFLRRAFDGDRVTMSCDSFDIDGFRLTVMPPTRPRVLVAALRERMLRLAGSASDGVILNWLSADDVRTVVPYVEDGRDEPADVAARIFVVPTEDRERVRALAAPLITAYLNVPTYAAYQHWLGRGPQLQAMWAAWSGGDRKRALAEVTDDVIDELFVHGSPQACRDHIQRYVDAGVTIPVLSVMRTDDGGDLAEIVSSLGPGRPASPNVPRPSADNQAT